MIPQEEKNLLILASAGSGKTYQLGNRIIALVAGGVDPRRIVALTFTRKAAAEFADTILTKLAEAASDPRAAERLSLDIGNPDADFPGTLGRMKDALPDMILGTMDSFFSRIIRGFQYELGLTGGRFELLEGQRADNVRDELLAELMAGTLEEGTVDELLHVFRRATIGKEGSGVARSLGGFVQGWHGRLRAAPEDEWGPAALVRAAITDWEKHKHDLIAKIRRNLGDIEWTNKKQPDAMEIMLDSFASHHIGSGSLEDVNSLTVSVLEAATLGNPVMRVKSTKDFIIGGVAGETLLELVRLAASGEMTAAVQRTQAIREAVEAYDQLCDTRLRRRGLLGFDDVKILMGEWVKGEDARLRREAVDYRLDGRYDHWLLDEFQDTSRAEWTGLFPLVDEAASSDRLDGTVFVVGDRKQAIYGWRGGDVRLFDEVELRYRGNIRTRPIRESWRSCPEVLALVNRVCGDMETLHALYPGAAERWEWLDHVSAEPLTLPAKSGESRVELCGDWDERMARMAEILHECGVGRRAISCGVLVRTNVEVRAIADYLRAEDFDVVEEGRREPGMDNPVGISLVRLLKWLADPADSSAWEILSMSPLSARITTYGNVRQAWEKLSALAAEHGFAHMVETLVSPLWEGWSAFGRRRAGDLISALASLDVAGGTTAREAAAWLEGMKISQSPGTAAVQVMTIHKAKGLGFDMVILPDIPGEVVPQANRFTVAAGDGWVTQPPVKWARRMFPEMIAAEESWAADQQYEAICMLYVALTRAKRAQYVLLEPPAKTASPDKPSLANWVARSLESSGEPGIVFQSGSTAWAERIPLLEEKAPPEEDPPLAAAVPRRERATASWKAPVSRSKETDDALAFGHEVHALLEGIAWIDETSPTLPRSRAADLVENLLTEPSMRRIFARDGRQVTLLREQSVDAIQNGKWLSGVIDRLILHHGPDGSVVDVDIIDFKTDEVDSPSTLRSRHEAQMRAYAEALSLIYPGAGITSLIVSTTLRAVVEV